MLPDLVEHFFGRDRAGAEGFKFSEGLAAFFRIQGFNRIPNDADFPSTLEQAFCGQAHTVLGDHAENEDFSVSGQAFDKGMSVVAFEDVQRVLVQMELVEFREIFRQTGGRVIRNDGDFFGARLGDEFRARGAFDAVRRKLLKFRIVRSVNAAVGDEQDVTRAGGIGKALNIRDQSLRAGNIELAIGQHEVGLRVYFPENDVVAHLWASFFLAASLKCKHRKFKIGRKTSTPRTRSLQDINVLRGVHQRVFWLNLASRERVEGSWRTKR